MPNAFRSGQLILAVAIALSARPAPAQDEAEPGKRVDSKPVPLNKQGTVLLDKPNDRLLLKSKVSLRRGVLEMLVCRKNTKEHESILAVDSKAYVVHTGLLALGAKAGRPVRFAPKFQPPQGQKLAIHVRWTDEDGKEHRVPAQKWVRYVTRRYYDEPLAKLPAGLKIPEDSELRYDAKNKALYWFGPMSEKQRDALLKLSKDDEYRKAIRSFYERSQPRQMQADWIFAGSSFFVDEKTGEKFYQAESGDLICVANFPTAMVDVSVRSSSQGEQNLLFEAWTERIPPLGTEVTVEIVPLKQQDEGQAGDGSPDRKPASDADGR